MPLKKYLDYDGLDYLIQRIPRTKIRVTFDDVFAGETATCSMGTTTYTKTVPATEPYELVFPINELGTWTIATSYLGDDYGTTIEVTAIGQTATGHVSHVTEIDGSTVEPTDDITTWLKCANIEDPTITTLEDVLANRSLFETLIANSNACKYMARSTSWALAEELVPTMTSNTTPSGEVIFGSNYGSSYDGFKAFDRDVATRWNNNQSTANDYIGYHFTSPICVRKVKIRNLMIANFKIQASNDGTNWIDLTDTLTLTNQGQTQDPNNVPNEYFDINNNDEYSYYIVRCLTGYNTNTNFSAYEVQFYEADITRNQDAMSLIGKYDYCSNELLSNATWAEAIANSDYRYSVLQPLVPAMTSNTTPSGEVITDTTPGTNSYPWHAFANNTSLAYQTYFDSKYVGYKFTEKVNVKYLYFYSIYGDGGSGDMFKWDSFKLQGSNDGTAWTDIQSFTNTQSVKDFYAVVNNTNSYLYYRLSDFVYGGGYDSIRIQFYGRESTQTNIIHSAPNDTIYILENGSQVVLTTTDSDGIGTLDFSQFMDGTYTLYSSVAKDPNNLSNDYSKSVRITKSSYGSTTEVYLMPDTVKTLYWWGYEDNELEDMSTANGWTAPNGYSFAVPTHNTNNIYCDSSSGNKINAVSSKTKHRLSKVIAIAEGKVKYAQTDCGEVQCRNSKSYSDCTYLGVTTKDVIGKWEIASSNIGQYMASFASSGSRASILYALWCE